MSSDRREDRTSVTAEPRPEPGTRLTFAWRKWDGAEHWRHDCLYLGADEWGDWFGQRAGWRSVRPGRNVAASGDNVSLLPPEGEWAHTWNAPPAMTRIYIDLAWRGGWHDGVPNAIDMDLDVVRRDPPAPYIDREGVPRRPGDVYIEDRDEWEEHRVAYGYPADVVSRLEARALELERLVRAGARPFDEGTAAHWLARLNALAPGPDASGRA